VAGLGCADYTPIEPRSDTNGSTIGELRSSPGRDGERVLLPSVVVVAHDTFDEAGSGRTGTVHLVDPGNEPDHGLQAFGPQLQIPAGDKLRPGNIVDVEGTYVRFDGPGCETGGSCFQNGRVIPQMDRGAVIDRVGYWKGPEPIELGVQEYLASPGRYVGNLITLRGLVASEGYTPSNGGDRLNPFATEQGVNVSAELHRIPGVTQGTRIERLTGVASFFFSDFVMPRGPEDVQLDPSSPRLEGDRASCTDDADNDQDGRIDCNDPGCCQIDVCRPMC
jgi:hypothetical protein